MKPAKAAQQIGMSEAALREVNAIPPRMLVKAGSTLIVPRTTALAADVPEHVADNAAIVLAPDLPPLRKVSFKAGKKDSVASVARRYRVSPAQVAQWNEIDAGARFKPGQTVVVYQPAKGSVRVAAAAKPAPRTSTKGRPLT